MYVYAVVSEMMHEIHYEPPDEEWGCVAVIVAARNRGQARYLAARHDRATKSYGPVDWPRFWCKRLGEADLPAGVLEYPADREWWLRVGDWNPQAQSVAGHDAA